MFAGVDVSKKWVDVALSDGDVYLPRAKPEEAAKWIKNHGVTLVALEATGGYELPMVHALNHENIKVARVNPQQVRQFAGAIGQRAKTDLKDAKVLAIYAKALQPEPLTLAEKPVLSLRALCARRGDLIAMRTAENNRLQQTDDARVRASIQNILDALALSLKEIVIEIKAFFVENPTLNALCERLCTMPGVGIITAATLLAQMPELGTASRTQIAALAGVAPYTRQSGVWKGKSFCSGGRSIVRNALYMAALSAIRGKNRFAEIYTALKNKGKPAKLALVAVMRKMLISLNAMIAKNTDFCDTPA
jgi:transposase